MVLKLIQIFVPNREYPLFQNDAYLSLQNDEYSWFGNSFWFWKLEQLRFWTTITLDKIRCECFVYVPVHGDNS